VSGGSYASASEVVRDELRLLERKYASQSSEAIRR